MVKCVVYVACSLFNIAIGMIRRVPHSVFLRHLFPLPLSLCFIECGSVFACDECFAFDNIQSNFRVRIVFHLNDVNNFDSKFSLSIFWSHWSQEYHIQDTFNDAYNWSYSLRRIIIITIIVIITMTKDTNVEFAFPETVSDNKKWKWIL